MLPGLDSITEINNLQKTIIKEIKMNQYAY